MHSGGGVLRARVRAPFASLLMNNARAPRPFVYVEARSGAAERCFHASERTAAAAASPPLLASLAKPGFFFFRRGEGRWGGGGVVE